MPSSTYLLISSQTLATPTATISFSSIPQTYRDLVLVINIINDSGDGATIRFNDDSGNNYANMGMIAHDGSTYNISETISSIRSGNYWTGIGNSFISIINIMDYSTTNKNKVVLTHGGNPEVSSWVSRWGNNAAINKISITSFLDTFPIGSVFSLYGIAS